jgi:hypothetical protein
MELRSFSPEAEAHICQSLRSKAFDEEGYAAAGKYLLAILCKNDPTQLDLLPEFLAQVLAPPGSLRDLAHWWLLFASLAASVRFRQRCIAPSREETLTGRLLECLSTEGEKWGQHLLPMLSRTGSQLQMHNIDLQLLGGEQATGGDFGLILDFDGRTLQPSERHNGQNTGRIVPLIFQAKRYARPTADVSQYNNLRGYQRDVLASNTCASAYIFYENDRAAIPQPLPPLVKRVEHVQGCDKTDVRHDSLDLASYLLRAATDQAYAPSALDTEDALRMIYANADSTHLAALLVISGDPNSGNRYSSSLATVASELGDEEQPSGVTIRFD